LTRSSSSRWIYSAAYLGIDISLFARQRTLHPHQEIFKDQVRNNFYKTKLSNILVDDIDKFISLSVSEEDLELSRKLIGAAANDEFLKVIEPDFLKELFSNFIQVCYLQNNPHEAMQAWKDPCLMNDIFELSKFDYSKPSVIYLNLLLQNGMYEELLATFSADQDNLMIVRKAILLSILACYKLGTKEALTRCVQYLSIHKQMKGVPEYRFLDERMWLGAALLAFNLEEYAKAHMIIQHYQQVTRRKKGKFEGTLVVNSLMMMVLAKSGRLEEAIILMKEICPQKNMSNAPRRVCYTAVETVVAAASQASKETFSQVMEIVDDMDDKANVVEDTMEEILFKAIDIKEKIVKEIQLDDADI